MLAWVPAHYRVNLAYTARITLFKTDMSEIYHSKAPMRNEMVVLMIMVCSSAKWLTLKGKLGAKTIITGISMFDNVRLLLNYKESLATKTPSFPSPALWNTKLGNDIRCRKNVSNSTVEKSIVTRRRCSASLLRCCLCLPHNRYCRLKLSHTAHRAVDGSLTRYVKLRVAHAPGMFS